MKTITVTIPDTFYDALVRDYGENIGAGIRKLMRHYMYGLHETPDECPYPYITNSEEVCAAWVLLSGHDSLGPHRFGYSIIRAWSDKSERRALAKFGIYVTPKTITFTDKHSFIRDIWELHGFKDTWKEELLGFVGSSLTPCGNGVKIPYKQIERLILEMP